MSSRINVHDYLPYIVGLVIGVALVTYVLCQPPGPSDPCPSCDDMNMYLLLFGQPQ